MILYSNSDSYGVLCQKGKDTPYGNVYGKFISDELKCKFINRGRSGTCNSRILRTSTRDLISLRQQNPKEKIKALISLATTYRSETWTEENTYIEDQDGHFSSFLANEYYGHSLKEQNEFIKSWITYYNNEAEQTNLLWQVIMFTNMLKSFNIDYLLWWGPLVGTLKPIEYSEPFISNFYKEFKKDPNILSFEDFSFCNWCLDQGFEPFDKKEYNNFGHHGPVAHQAFANYLMENYL